MAFKPGTNDVRGAVPLDVIKSLVERGAQVRAYDPQASESASRLLPDCVDIVNAPEETARGTRALILLTEWGEIAGADWEGMSTQMRPPRFLIDGRNALDAPAWPVLGLSTWGLVEGTPFRFCHKTQRQQ